MVLAPKVLSCKFRVKKVKLQTASVAAGDNCKLRVKGGRLQPARLVAECVKVAACRERTNSAKKDLFLRKIGAIFLAARGGRGAARTVFVPHHPIAGIWNA